jgi:hypothetical protein
VLEDQDKDTNWMKALDKSKKRFEVRIVSDTLVKGLSLQIRGANATFDDNCYDMAPGAERNMEVTLEKPMKPSELRGMLQSVEYR